MVTYPTITTGGVPERLIGAVLKTVVRSRVPWVRIPPPPPFKKPAYSGFFVCKNLNAYYFIILIISLTTCEIFFVFKMEYPCYIELSVRLQEYI